MEAIQPPTKKQRRWPSSEEPSDRMLANTVNSDSTSSAVSLHDGTLGPGARSAASGIHGDDDDDDLLIDDKEEVDPRLEAFLSRRTLEFPRRVVPLEHPFIHDRLYVRKCYREYYDKIWHMLTNNRGVTVTGTPGIGKSLMMVYFFMRYTLEHPEATVVMIAFHSDMTMRSGKVWRHDQSVGLERKDVLDLEREIDDDNALFLFDGPPPHYLKKHKFIAFSSPNHAWEKMISKMAMIHAFLVMPLWDAEELLDAVDALQLQDTLEHFEVPDFPSGNNPRYNHEVLYRYDVFGGVARPCLAVNRHAVDQLHSHLLASTVSGVDPYRQQLLLHNEDDRHQVFHQVPTCDVEVFSLKAASPYVLQMLSSVGEAILRSKKASSQEAKTLARKIHELNMHKDLESGSVMRLKAISLDQPQRKQLSLVIGRRRPGTLLLKSAFTVEDLAGNGPYFKPQSAKLESIDAFYWVPNSSTAPLRPWRSRKVIVFQSTISKSQSVIAKALYLLLQQLGISQEDWASHVALVFAVPRGSGDFKRQRIDALPAIQDTFSIKRVRGIQAEILAALAGTNITTVWHLRNRPSNALLVTTKQQRAYETAKTLLQQHEDSDVFIGSSIHRALDQIPQFVWRLPS